MNINFKTYPNTQGNNKETLNILSAIYAIWEY